MRRRRLGMELRDMRVAAGLTCDEVGKLLDWSGAKVSRIETSRIGVRPRDVQDLLDVYGITDQTKRSGLITLTRESQQKGWWHEYSHRIPDWMAVYVGFEAEASAMRQHQLDTVPGLLQTEDYARAVLRAVWVSKTAEQIERLVELRLIRQAVLTKDGPLRLWVVLDEAALHRAVGGPSVLHGQLKHLVDVADLPNVTLQVLPFSVGGHAGLGGSFSILEFPEPNDPVLVLVETATAGLFVEGEAVRSYAEIFDHLRAVSLGPNESVELVAHSARDR